MSDDSKRSPGQLCEPSEAKKNTWMREMAGFEMFARLSIARGDHASARRYLSVAHNRRQALEAI